MSLLRLVNVTKRFGGLVAVDNFDLEVKPGEILGIVGPNGSGKTTLFNVINGVFFPEEGQVFFDGQDITRLPAHKRAPLGLGRTFQIPRPFGSASVLENVAIGAMFGTLAREISVDEAMAIADRYVQLVGLEALRDKQAKSLTPVEKKMMEMGRALAMKPRLLLMDEVMAGMNPRDIDDLVRFLIGIMKRENIAVVSMVEHIMRAVTGLAERVVVMNHGAKLVDAETAEALSDPRVVEVYLGRALDKPAARPPSRDAHRKEDPECSP